jgi:hypothetical protein
MGMTYTNVLCVLCVVDLFSAIGTHMGMTYTKKPKNVHSHTSYPRTMAPPLGLDSRFCFFFQIFGSLLNVRAVCSSRTNNHVSVQIKRNTHTHIYIYIHIYTHIRIYIYIYINVYIRIIYIYIYIYVYIYKYRACREKPSKINKEITSKENLCSLLAQNIQKKAQHAHSTHHDISSIL